MELETEPKLEQATARVVNGEKCYIGRASAAAMTFGDLIIIGASDEQVLKALKILDPEYNWKKERLRSVAVFELEKINKEPQ